MPSRHSASRTAGRREGLATFAQRAFVVFAVFNGLAMAFGLFELLADHPFPIRLILSVAGGCTIASVLAAGWHMLLVSAKGGERDWPTGVLGMLMALFGIALSAWILAGTIDGDEALKADRSSHLDALYIQAGRIGRNGELDQRVVDAVAAASVEVAEMAKAEEAVGLISKIDSGKGEWARALAAYASTLSAAEGGMADLQTKRTERLKLFDKLLIEARLAASAGDGPRFEEMSIKASRLLADADRMAAHPKVSALGSGLMAKEAGDEIATVQTKLTDFASTAETQWVRTPVPFYAPISKHVATARQAGAVPGAWLIGVAFEVLPFMLLLMVLVQARDRDPPEHMPVPVDATYRRPDNSEEGAHLREVA